MTIQSLTLEQHQKLQGMFDTEEERLIKLRIQAGNDSQFVDQINKEIRYLSDLRTIILALPHNHSHYKTMPKINCADKQV